MVMQRIAANRFLPRILAAVESCHVKTITTNTPLILTGLRSVVECQHRFAPISSVISRSFSNSGAPLSSTLSNILRKEIDYEKHNYSQPEVRKMMTLRHVYARYHQADAVVFEQSGSLV
jgi:hypothetical protein